MITLFVNDFVVTPAMKIAENVPTRFISNKLFEKTFKNPKQLANFLLEGKTIATANYNEKRKSENFKSTRIFCVDIDGGNIEKFKEECSIYNIKYSFLYSTFRDGVTIEKKNSKSEVKNTENEPEKNPEDCRRFRAVFVYEKEITNINHFKAISDLLIKKLFVKKNPDGSIKKEGADTNCSDAARLFYGGKELLDSNFDALLTEKDLCTALYEYSGTANGKRNVENFKNKLADLMLSPSTRIYNTALRSEHQSETINSKNVNDFNHSEKKSGQKPTVKQRLTPEIKKQLLSKCKLLREFHAAKFSSPDGMIQHKDLKHLFYNLIQWEGGYKWFMEMLEVLISKGIEPAKKRDGFKASYFGTGKDYENTTACKGNCPNFKNCIRSGYNINQQIVKKNKHVIYLPEDRKPKTKFLKLKDTRDLLIEILNSRYLNPLKRITIIKMDTGIGKTEAMIKLPFHLKKTICAFPYHNLKDETYERKLKVNDLIPFKTVKLEIFEDPIIQKTIETIDANGIPIKLDYLKSICDATGVSINDAENARSFLYGVARKKYNSCIWSTHEDVLISNFEYIETIIFDEDPMDSILKNDTVSTEAIGEVLKKLKDDNQFPTVQEYLTELLNAPFDELVAIKPKCSKVDWNTFIVRYQYALKTNEPLGKIFYSTGQHRSEKSISFGTVKELDKTKNIIILSATINESMYAKYKDEVEFIDLSNVETKGKVFIEPSVTYSRQSFADMETRKENILDVMKTPFEELNIEAIISFKKNEKKFEKSNLAFYHFGALQGIDILKGKNIAIIGTPYPSFEVVEMMNFLYTGNIIKNKNKIKTRFDYKEFSIELFLFENEELRKVQLWLMEKEIIQAVGRARIINENCNVYIFGVFPVAGAQIIPKVTRKQIAA